MHLLSCIVSETSVRLLKLRGGHCNTRSPGTRLACGIGCVPQLNRHRSPTATTAIGPRLAEQRRYQPQRREHRRMVRCSRRPGVDLERGALRRAIAVNVLRLTAWWWWCLFLATRILRKFGSTTRATRTRDTYVNVLEEPLLYRYV